MSDPSKPQDPGPRPESRPPEEVAAARPEPKIATDHAATEPPPREESAKGVLEYLKTQLGMWTIVVVVAIVFLAVIIYFVVNR